MEFDKFTYGDNIFQVIIIIYNHYFLEYSYAIVKYKGTSYGMHVT